MKALKAQRPEKKIGTWYKEARRLFQKELGTQDSFEPIFEAAPNWMRNIFGRIEASLNRAYNIRNDSNDPVLKLGIIAGHFGTISEADFKLPKKAGRSLPDLEKALKKLPSIMTPIQESLAKWSLDLRTIMAKQPPVVQVSFNNGYERALKRRIFTGKEPAFWETSSTKLYVLLLLLGPWMHTIKSVAMLDKILSKVGNGIWTSSDPKRLQKLCQRIGLSFRKRGSPPKSEQVKKFYPISSRKSPRR
jgi:hypothetical protein